MRDFTCPHCGITTQIERDTLTVPQVCDRIGVSRRTVYNWMNLGKIEYCRSASGMRRVFIDTLFKEDRHGKS